MSRAHAESVMKKIIREIVQKSAIRGQVVSESLAAFMVSNPNLPAACRANVSCSLRNVSSVASNA